MRTPTEDHPDAARLARAFRSAVRQLCAVQDRIAAEHGVCRWRRMDTDPREIDAGATATLLEASCARLLKQLSETAPSHSA